MLLFLLTCQCVYMCTYVSMCIAMSMCVHVCKGERERELRDRRAWTRVKATVNLPYHTPNAMHAITNTPTLIWWTAKPQQVLINIHKDQR